MDIDKCTDFPTTHLTADSFAAGKVYAFISCPHILYINTFTAIVDLSRSNFSVPRAQLFQLKSAKLPVIIGGKLTQQLQYI